MIRAATAMALALVFGGIAASPALADHDDHRHGHGHWRHERRDRGWYGHGHGRYFSPWYGPDVYYAPPPPVIYAPLPRPGINFVFPLHIR